MDYDHTQTAPLYLFLFAIGIGCLSGGMQTDHPAVPICLFILGAFFFLLGLCFRQLTCRDEGDYLRIRFGLIPLFRRKLLYSRLEKVEHGRSRLLDG